MRNKLLTMSAFALMVALLGGVIAKQMALSRLVSACSQLAKTLSNEGNLEGLRITPLADSKLGKGLLVNFSSAGPPPDWEGGEEEWFLRLNEQVAIKAIVLKGIPAGFLVIECQGRKLLVTSTHISKFLPELAQKTADS